MNKEVAKRWGNQYYLLGADSGGIKYWLQSASWDCKWYWGLGYVETFRYNANPQVASDIDSHQHYDGLFLKYGLSPTPQEFRKVLPETPLSDDEIWRLNELMKTAYTARQYSDMLHIGGAHISTNPCRALIENEAEYKRINEKIIPGLMKEVYKLLMP